MIVRRHDFSIFSDYSDPTRIERLAAYIVRAAHGHAYDPMDFQKRYLAGLAVKRRVRIGKTAGRVYQFNQTRKTK